MKKKLFIILLLCSVITLNAQFTGPGLQVTTVQEAKSLRDDTPVLLRGNIERFLGDEKYLFSDNTGTIIIEIDDRLWKNLSVSNSDVVEIVGEIDKEFIRVEIEVNEIKKL